MELPWVKTVEDIPIAKLISDMVSARATNPSDIQKVKKKSAEFLNIQV